MKDVEVLFIGMLVLVLIGGSILLFVMLRIGDADSRRQLAMGELAAQRGYSFDAAGSDGVVAEQRELPEGARWRGCYRRLLRWTDGPHEVVIYEATRDLGELIQSLTVCLIKRAGRRSPHFLIERDYAAFFPPKHLKRIWGWRHPRLRLVTQGDPREVEAFLTPVFFERLATYPSDKVNVESNGEVLMLHLSRVLEPNQLEALSRGAIGLMLAEREAAAPPPTNR